MLTRLRALFAVILLAGFHLLVAGTVAGLVVLARLLGNAGGRLLAYVALVVAGATIVALWRVVRLKPDDWRGLVVPRDAAPRLWATVEDLAARVDTRVPDEIRIVPEVNAAVSERAHLLGLVGGRRTLLVGLPLLQTFTVSQLRAVLAHEMGHYSHSHTRLAAVTYRGRTTMMAIIAHVGPQNLVGLLFAQYARLFFLVEAAVSRRQEIEADRAAARIAGRAAAMSALADLPGLGAAWRFYLDRYVGRGLRFGYAPDALFLGFPRLVAARADELAKARSNPAEPERSRWDSHPPIADRLAIIAAMPEDGSVADSGPAHVLVPDLAALAGQLESLVLSLDEQERLPWDEYLARVAEAELTSTAAALLGEFAQQAGRDSASVADLVDAVGTPAYDGFVRSVLPPGSTEADPAAGNGPLGTVIAACAVRSGVARGAPSWLSGPPVLVGGDGERFDAERIAARLADPGTAAAAREELRERGIGLDPTADRAGTAEEGRPLGAASNVVVDGKRRDLIIYDTGLLVVPGSRRRRMRQSQERLHKLATESTVEELRSIPGSRYVPFHEVVRCAPDRKSLLAHVVTLIGGMSASGGRAFAFALTLTGGDVVRMRWGMETEFLGDSSEILASCVAQLSARRSADATADASG